MKRVAVILSGCGVFDGSEIHESVLTLYFLEKAQAEVHFLSLNDSYEVVNHLTSQVEKEKCNMLVESARIARGKIRDITTVTPAEFDACILPGGFGAAKNLCNFATEGEHHLLHAEVQHFLKEMIALKKPLGFICISPVMIPKLYPKGVKLTIGHDAATAKKINLMGGAHIPADVTQIVIDQANKVVSTPAYMEAKNIVEVAIGIEKLVNAVLAL